MLKIIFVFVLIVSTFSHMNNLFSDINETSDTISENQDTDFIKYLPENKSSIDTSKNINAYHMKVEDETVGLIPSLYLDMDKKTFSFQYDILSSYYNYGNFEISDNKKQIICYDSESEKIFVFDKHDDYLTYNFDFSTNVKLVNNDVGYQITEDSIFVMD